jgi:sortase A
MRRFIGVLVVILATFVLACSAGSSEKEIESGITIQSAATPVSEVSPEPVVATPTPQVRQVAQPDKVVVGDSLSIPKIRVEAPLVLMHVNVGEEMPAPKGPRDVVYYAFPPNLGFGGKVGQPGNAVFSGHVDLVVNNQPQIGVFWELKSLKAGDEILVKVDDKTYKYAVTTNRSEPAVPPIDDLTYWNRIVEATESETITLITCTGNFNPRTREYESRQVVTAVKS